MRSGPWRGAPGTGRKLTEAQADQALDPVLKQIGQTTEPFALLALAQALQALPVKLTEAQASKALDPVLKQIGQTRYPNVVNLTQSAVLGLWSLRLPGAARSKR